MRNFKNYIFDMDGTLINSSEEVLLCLKKAFIEAGISIDENKFTSDKIGPPLKIIIKSIAPEIEDDVVSDKVMANFRRIYDYSQDDKSYMYEGMYDILKNLKEQNKRLFIATFKPSIPTMRLVKKFNLNMFEDVYTIDKFSSPITKQEMIEDIVEKYNLSKVETVMIGDALSDITAAKNAGVASIGVLWGYDASKTKLIESADIIVEKVKDLECPKLNSQII